MTISVNSSSVVAGRGQAISFSSMVWVSPGGDPQYLVVDGLDRNEYTAASNGNTGTISGNGHSLGFSSIGGDSSTFGIVFTYNAATNQYVNATYGNLSNVVLTASTDPNRNEAISFFGANSLGALTNYASNPYSLSQLGSSVSYFGTVDVVTQPRLAGQAPAQATPDSIASAAQSFVGQAWNDNGCWTLACNIAAEAGASLPVASTMLGVPGQASGEWFVAYDGPAGQSGDWQSMVTAGEMVVFETSDSSGHITTVVSGSGSSAKLIDNIAYVYSNGTIANSAHDGSSNDVIVAAPHAANEEFSQAVPGSVVIYELDTPTIDATTGSSVVAGGSRNLSDLFSATDPNNKAITEYQIFDTTGQNYFLVDGSVAAAAANSADSAVTVDAASLANAFLLATGSIGNDALEVRAFNGSYWGDWQSFNVDLTGGSAAAPVLTDRTGRQYWSRGQAFSLALPADAFTDPQDEALTYSIHQTGGPSARSWLHFDRTTDTLHGFVPWSTGGTIWLKVGATNTSGLSASETFAVSLPTAAGNFASAIAALADTGQASQTLTHAIQAPHPLLATPHV